MNRKFRSALVAVLIVVLSITLISKSLDYFDHKEVVEIESTGKMPSSLINRKQIYQADLVMVGDALLHPPVITTNQLADGSYDFSDMMSSVKEQIQGYDLKFYNQEVILGGDEYGVLGYPQFNALQAFGDWMIDDTGFNLVSLANNHTLDMGPVGVKNSASYWKGKEAVTSGSYGSQEDYDAKPIYEINGISYAFLSYTENLNGLVMPEDQPYLVDHYSEEKVRSDVAYYRPLVDVIIVNMHAGDEYVHYPNNNQEYIANLLSECGVDIMIGQHPHVIQPIDRVNDMVTIYSLGNFVSAQIGEERMIELIAAVDITKTVEGNETTIKVDNIRADLMYNWYQGDFEKFKVYMLNEIPLELLPNREQLYADYEKIVKAYREDIKMGSLKKGA